jgi:EF hand
MKKTLISAAVATLVFGSGFAYANDRANDKANDKHRYAAPGYAHGNHFRHAPPVVTYHRPYYRPSHVVHHYGPRHHTRGYWRDGRWIAPVVVGATIGALAISASTPVYAAPAPSYYEPAPVAYHHAPVDRFSSADVNGDGYLSYYESRRHGNLYRNFAQVDWNGDGYLSRSEVDAWRHGW